MLVRAHCGNFVGPPKWQGIEHYEPDECGWAELVIVDADEWAEGCVSVRCGRCYTELFQSDEHFEQVEQKEAATTPQVSYVWSGNGAFIGYVVTDDGVRYPYAYDDPKIAAAIAGVHRQARAQ